LELSGPSWKAPRTRSPPPALRASGSNRVREPHKQPVNDPTGSGPGQVKTATQKGLPGEEKVSYDYDENNRLKKAGSEYKYNAADNPTKTASGTNTYNEADELTKSTSVTYSYDELGERTKRTPTTGPATTYSYNEAGNLTSVTRLKEGETPAIEDSYTYNGEGLRASETISGTTNYLTWDTSIELPSILSNGSYSFIYGPGAMPIEQINAENKVQYLHHDEQGSTRLITASTGTTEGTYTYSAYGETTGHTGTATTPLGYDAQYTNSDTGLVYMHARTYDPTTAQFLTVDPLADVTRAPYNYAGDNPVNYADRSGLASEGEIELPCVWPFCGPPPSASEGLEHLGQGIAEGARESYEGVKHGAESIWNAISSEGESSNESTQAGQSEDGCRIPRSAIDAEAALKRIARENPDIPRGELGKALERAKNATGVPASGDTKIDPGTGDIYDVETGEQIGNVFD
jgi:RHS repeat-associated protein